MVTITYQNVQLTVLETDLCLAPFLALVRGIAREEPLPPSTPHMFRPTRNLILDETQEEPTPGARSPCPHTTPHTSSELSPTFNLVHDERQDGENVKCVRDAEILVERPSK